MKIKCYWRIHIEKPDVRLVFRQEPEQKRFLVLVVQSQTLEDATNELEHGELCSHVECADAD